jgi:hypothetical protein
MNRQDLTIVIGAVIAAVSTAVVLWDYLVGFKF